MELYVGNTQHVIAHLANREDDVAVVAATIQHAQLVVEPVGFDPVVVIVPRQHSWARRATMPAGFARPAGQFGDGQFGDGQFGDGQFGGGQNGNGQSGQNGNGQNGDLYGGLYGGPYRGQQNGGQYGGQNDNGH